MPCPNAEQLDLFLSGSLDIPDRSSIESHLESCDDCQAALDDFRGHRLLLDRLQSALADSDADDLSIAEHEDATPEIDGYSILAELHRGGQGVVYHARQHSTDREVAIKLLLRGRHATIRQQLRFEREMEILAGLRHPGIVTVFDRGATTDGRSYLVMELVEGHPLDRFIAEGEPTVGANMALLMKICDAVSAAHQRGVIHRDLKPANIIVDDAGDPHVLDFGLARPTEALATVEGQTVAGEFMGTLAYASPEQVAGRTDEVDVRADVYALGVIMYEMLAGRLPHDFSVSLRDIVRQITEHTPAAPSTHRPGLDADLDVIALTCLAQEPDRRYPSVAALREDLRRQRERLPIAARADSRWYVLRKTLRRHRGAVAAALVLVLSLTGGIIATTRQARIAETERAAAEEAQTHAEAEAERVTAVLDFVKHMLTAVDPAEDGKSVTVYETLDKAEGRIDEELASNPGVAASLHNFMGISYHALGEYERAADHYRDALRNAAEAYPDDPERVLTYYPSLGTSLMELGRFEDVGELEKEALPRLRAELGDQHPATLSLLNIIAGSYRHRGMWREAAERFKEVTRLREEVHGPEHVFTLSSRQNLANILDDLGRPEEAEPLFRQVVDVYTRTLGPDNPRTLRTMNNFAFVLENTGKRDEAFDLRTTVLERRREVLGPEHPDTLTAMNNIAYAHRLNGRYDKAVEVLIETAELRIRVLGADNPNTLTSRNNLALNLYTLGRLDDALPIAIDVLKRRRERLGNDHPHTAGTADLLGSIQRDLDNPADAESLFREALQICRKRLGDGHVSTANVMANLSSVLRADGRYEEAITLADERYRSEEKRRGPTSTLTLSAGNTLGWTYVDAERFDEALELFESLLAITREKHPDAHARIATYARGVGTCLMELGNLQAAETILRATYDELLPELGEDHDRITRLADLIADIDDRLASEAGQS